MALNDILEQIKKETQEKLDKMSKEHAETVKKLEAEFEKMMKNAQEEMDGQVTANSEKILNKMATHAKMEAKNKLLKEKREVMDAIFDEALEALVSSSNYEKLLTELLKHSAIKGDDVKVVPAKGKEDATRAALSASGKSFQMSDKSTDIKGGFILVSEKIEIDNSFESILNKQLRDDLELEVAQTIFSA
ncbi:V-type ATP synthase subunit E [Patescibacteria group bacterium]